MITVCTATATAHTAPATARGLAFLDAAQTQENDSPCPSRPTGKEKKIDTSGHGEVTSEYFSVCGEIHVHSPKATDRTLLINE